MRGLKNLCIWFLEVATLFALLLFFLWLAIRPSEPHYSLIDLSVSAANATTHLPLRNISVTIEIANGKGVRHGESNVTLSSRGVLLGRIRVPSFYQGRDRSMRWEGSVGVDEGTWRKAVRGGGGGERALRVRVLTSVRYRILAWDTRPYKLDLEAAVLVGAHGRVSLGGKSIRLRRVRGPGEGGGGHRR